MPVRPRVAVIVLNYNGVDHLRSCLPSLEALDYDNVEIVVADNGSTESVPTFVPAYPGARILEMGQNLGFSRAYNRAVPRTARITRAAQQRHAGRGGVAHRARVRRRTAIQAARRPP